MIAVTRVLCINMHEHPDNYYYFISIKCAKQFTSTFADMSVVIFQNNKAKIDLRVLAVSHIFCILQSINKSTTIADHDFSIRSRQKLILSVYLMINLNKSNNKLQIK